MKNLFVYIKKNSEFIKYIFVNGMTTILYVLLYYIFNEYLELHYIYSNIISYMVAIFIAYLLTAIYVFERKSHLVGNLGYFIVQRILMIGVSSILIWILVDSMKVNKYFSQLIVTGICFMGSYSLNKRLFKNKKK